MLRGPFTLFTGLVLFGATQHVALADQDTGNYWLSGTQNATYKTTGGTSSFAQSSSMSDDYGVSEPRVSLASATDDGASAAPSAPAPAAAANGGPCGCGAQGGYCGFGGGNGCGSGQLYPFIGVEATFFAPVRSGGASASSSYFDGAATTVSNTANPNGFNVGPRISLGLVGDRWGVVARYWRFTDDSNTFVPTLTTGVLQQSYLHLQTFDVELIRRIWLGNPNNSLWFTLGGRYAEFNQGSSISSINTTGTSILTTTGASQTSFNGTGITGSVWGLRQIGCSRVSLFYGGRVSELWDSNARSMAQTSATYASIGGAAGTTNFAAASSATGSLFIGEVQVGLQYNHALRCLPGTAFFRTGFEYQYWGLNNMGSATSTSFAAGGGTAGIATAGAHTGFLDLVGFNVGTGFMW